MEARETLGDPLDLALRRELQPGERVLWQGKPLPRVALGGFALWLFAVPWTAFSVFWTAMAYAGASSDMADDAGLLAYAFPLFGVPFILIGLGMMSVPFLPLIFARRMLFAVTDRRLLQLRLGRSSLITKSVDADRIGSMERREGRDGAGTLKVEIGSSIDSDGDRRTEHFNIGEVPQVMQVEDRVREMLELADRRRALSS
ncbi:hypothetical protein [Alteraurantiacibacter aquimixticola]|uniref:PH domain-containing protein n=1 Tax=Alteraurantiacibacter aquimixticola TaxID=2489173 RepID=A0A4T3F2J4_9SPHN|nr:hypothetical protein [Alteraurantiacibacter aquimixticola]TIX51475.1 hypothetical protein E5222_03185 [Alteraurantiacibacter aquimixticola]